MKYQELKDVIASETDLSPKVVDQVLKALQKQVAEQLKSGGDVHLSDLGKFTVKHRAARTVRNPKTGEAIAVPETNVPKFTPSKGLEMLVA